ncbi:unnamed protein product [Meloidogyne enterolobii]|uniref:Uncharacterized protein n=1 Tax=Meloidogyne enterolobii TaxID=390850 RepID=A0ACB0XRJ4_MELEN
MLNRSLQIMLSFIFILLVFENVVVFGRVAQQNPIPLINKKGLFLLNTFRYFLVRSLSLFTFVYYLG